MDKDSKDKAIETFAANCIRLGNECRDLADENKRLKTEVERLNSELYTCSCANANMHKHKNDYARLKAEVERLTKAALQVHQELDEFGQVSAKSVHELRDATKGVQS